MRKNFFYIILLSVIGIFEIQSCKKSVIEEIEPYKDLKEWVRKNGSIFRSGTISFKTSSTITVNNLNWKKLTFFTEKNSKFYEIPFSNTNNGMGKQVQQIGTESDTMFPSTSALILEKNLSGALKAYIRIRMTDTSNVRDRKVYDEYYDMEGNWKYTWLLRPGFNPQRLYSYSSMGNNNVASLGTRKKALSCVYFSFVSYSITCTASSNSEVTCNFSPMTHYYSYCPSSGQPDENQIPQPDDPPGGGSYPYPPAPVTIDSVNNLLTNPCFKNVLSQVTDARLKGLIVKLFNSTFTSTGYNLNLEISENGSLVYPNGNMQLAKSNVIPNQGKWIIQLNPNYSTSKEYIAAAIIHELIHSFIFLYKQYQPPGFNFTDIAMHSAMFQNWINDFASLLKDSMGISNEDAVALSLSGIVDVLLDSEGLPTADADAFAQDKYKMSVASADAIASKYESKQKGTACP